MQLADIGQGLVALDEGYLPLAKVAADLDAVARQMDRDHDRFARADRRPLAGQRSNLSFYGTAMADAVTRGREKARSGYAQLTDPDERKALENMLEVLDDIDAIRVDYDAAFTEWLRAADGDPADAARALAELDTRRTELMLKVGHLSQLVEGRIQMVSARTTYAQDRAAAVSGALAALSALMAGILAWVALLTLRPIGLLTAQVQRLAAGDHTSRVAAHGRDEVGVLAGEFNAMADAVAERDRRLKERAEALDRLSLRLRSVLDTINAGLLVVQDSRIETANPAAQQMWQAREGEPPSAGLADLATGRHAGLVLGERLFDVEVVPFGHHGQLVVGEDVTDRTRDRERLAHSERLAVVGQMLAQITHEVRNPLNAMSLNAELLSEDLEGTEQQAMMETITQEIRRLEGLTGRYLELSRGRQPEFSPADPTELARDVLRVEEQALRRAGVDAAVSGPPLGVIELDTDALRRALRNLVRNAVEAGATDVQIRVHRHDDELRVAVTDDGPGMTDAELHRAFEPFFTTKAQGTGLGLAISRQELEDVGGTLRVTSAPGEGSTFHLTLPIDETA